MKLDQLLALALFAATPAYASAALVDFENTWDYDNGAINDYYNGGTAADGSSGPNLGVAFVNVSGLSNDAAFTYYSNAPSMLGVAYPYTVSSDDLAIINVAAGIPDWVAFYYSSPSAVTGAVKAYSGLNGTGTLLGSLDISANIEGTVYDTWTPMTFEFNGIARSFDLTAGANLVSVDNISAVPLPAAFWLFGAGLSAIGVIGRRRKA